MNIEKYTKFVAGFNNCDNAKAHDTNIIILPFKEYKWCDTLLLQIHNFDKVIYNSNRPLIKAFKSFYRTDCISSVFLQDKSHTILMGNERMLISHPQGEVFVCLTPFWVKNASFIHLRGEGNIFQYKNLVLFLDELQVPYPGGNYYHKNRTENIAVQPSKIDDLMRICFITKDLSVLEDMFITWNGRPNIGNYPFLTKTTILSISKFINVHPIQLNFDKFPEKVVKSTNLISKVLSRSNPNFLIQDILNTYRKASGSLDHIGLFIEYPFECDYENSCANDTTCSIVERRCNDDEQYAAFYVNGLNPKKILQVRRPYDRYLEYENYVPDVPMDKWTNILYVPIEPLPVCISRVIVDHTILGYEYKKAFLCLSYPCLSRYLKEVCGSETQCLLSPMDEKELIHDSDIRILEEYFYDKNHKLYHIQHDKIRNDLWCLSKINSPDDEEPVTKFPRRADPPEFVSKWLDFYNKNQDKNDLCFGDLKKFKLALVLARHKICFKLKRGGKREVKFVNGEHEIHLEEALVTFINEIRIIPEQQNKIQPDKVPEIDTWSSERDDFCTIS